MIDSKLRKYVQKGFDVVADGFIRVGIGPTAVTLSAGFLGVVASAILLFGTPTARILCFAVGAVSTLLDVLDGTIARRTGTTSPLGAFFDLMLDRVVEVSFIIAYTVVYPRASWASLVFLALVVVNFSAFLLAGSLFPNKGNKAMHYEGGAVERFETIATFGLMLAIPRAGVIFLWIFNALMLATAVGRISRIIRYARANGLDERGSRERAGGSETSPDESLKDSETDTKESP